MGFLGVLMSCLGRGFGAFERRLDTFRGRTGVAGAAPVEVSCGRATPSGRTGAAGAAPVEVQSMFITLNKIH
jgi:hypothetical protein